MRRTLIPTALLLATLALAGCSAPMHASELVTTAPDGGVMSSEGSRSEAITVEDSADVDRQVITSGSVTVTVDDPAQAAEDAVRITESAGGRVDARTERAPVNGNDGSASLTLRIPAAALTAALEKLKELGAVQEVSLSASDVTMETQDLDARIAALRASVDRMLALLASAADTETLIQLETAIAGRQGELESLEAQRRYYADQVDMSTITLDLVSEYTAPAAEPDTFLSGLFAGWNAFVAFFAGLLVAVGVLLPWLLCAAIIAVAVLAIVRWRRPRSRVDRVR